MSIVLRMRGHWEAVDLGAAMVRTWWLPVYGAWLAIVIPIALAANVIFLAWPSVAFFLVWWLKPLYDRVVLSVVARAVFGDIPSLRATLANFKVDVLRSDLVGGLFTLRRFDLSRTFNLPVSQLEGQRGSAARNRERVLGRQSGNQASGLIIACALFETMLVLSLTAVIDLFTPAALHAETNLPAAFRYLWGGEAQLWAQLLTNALFVTAMSVVEPMFVASGFALYLNRRTTLEAWDLELGFRVMAARQAARSHAARAAAVILALALSPWIAISPNQAYAAQSDSKSVIKEILAAPEFQEHRTEQVWKAKATSSQPADSDWLQWLGRQFLSLGHAVAEIARIGIYALLAVALFLAIRYLARELPNWRMQWHTRGPRAAPPEVLFGLDVRPAALPADLAKVAARLADTDPAAALSLLYRGALATLIHRDRLSVEPGDTEGDCVRRVERWAPASLGGYFRRLVDAWSHAAYANRIPNIATVQALCADYGQHFDQPAELA
jgi:hypothetical protein